MLTVARHGVITVVWARPVGPDGRSPMTVVGDRKIKEAMSAEAPDIKAAWTRQTRFKRMDAQIPSHSGQLTRTLRLFCFRDSTVLHFAPDQNVFCCSIVKIQELEEVGDTENLWNNSLTRKLIAALNEQPTVVKRAFKFK
jgi:hypothetical protein